MIITDKEMLRKAEVELSEADPMMAGLISEHGPCTISPWEKPLFTALVDSIISQQLSVKAAATISDRVKNLMPNSNEISAEHLIKLQSEELRECGLSRAKTKYALNLANAVLSGDLILSELREMDEDLIIKKLVSYPGIGQWTAEMFLIFAIGASDVISFGDLGLKRGMKFYLGLEDYPDEGLFYSTAEKWSPWRSVASWYLWRMVD